MKEFGLYIHIPFCKQKCHYCDFYSVSWSEKLGNKFLSALQKELRLLADKYNPAVKTIFIGGGTPTVMSESKLYNLLESCYQIFSLSPIEVTVEINPGTLDEDKLTALKQAGVTRLSFGVQSFNNFSLNKLGRIHEVKDVIDNYYLARKTGFKNINFDLIFALPGQQLADWKRTLKQACKLSPEHLSCYNLKLEPGTLFNKWTQEGKLEVISKEIDLKMYRITREFLAEAGYEQYEISNFARSGYECKHNKIYWINKPYLGAGPGAHFYDGRGRGYNCQDIKKYCKLLAGDKLPIIDYDKLSKEEKIEETMMMGLRLKEGISLIDFEEKYKSSVFDLYREEIKELRKQNLLKVEGGRLFLTPRGMELANSVLVEFLLT